MSGPALLALASVSHAALSQSVNVGGAVLQIWRFLKEQS